MGGKGHGKGKEGKAKSKAKAKAKAKSLGKEDDKKPMTWDERLDAIDKNKEEEKTLPPVVKLLLGLGLGIPIGLGMWWYPMNLTPLGGQCFLASGENPVPPFCWTYPDSSLNGKHTCSDDDPNCFWGIRQYSMRQNNDVFSIPIIFRVLYEILCIFPYIVSEQIGGNKEARG